MRVTSANIRNNPDMSPDQVRHDVRAVRDWQRPGHVVFWQEIGERADHRAIARAFPLALSWRQLFDQRQTPISLRTLSWSVSDHWYVRTHGGRGGVTPARGFGVVLVRHRRHRELPPVALIGTHFISGAWYGHHSFQEWRRDRWREHFAALDDQVGSLNAEGVSVVVGGDWNRRRTDIVRFTAAQLWAVSHGYDHVAVCPAKDGAVAHITASDVMDRAVYTDHKPVRCDITWSTR